MTNELRERVAKVLGWTVADTNGFGLSTLMELVREKDAKLHGELRALQQSGGHLFGPALKARSRTRSW